MRPGQVIKPLRKLLPKHHAFISEYLLDFNGKRAAQAVGYTEKSSPGIAHRFVRDPLIKAEIKRLQSKALATAGITADYVLYTIRDIIELNKGPGMTAGQHQVALRGLELMGKHLNLWDKEDGSAHRRVGELTDKELLALGMQLQKGKSKSEPHTIECKVGGTLGGTPEQGEL